MTIKWGEWKEYPDSVAVSEAERNKMADELFASPDTIMANEGDTLMYAERDDDGFIKIYDCQVRRIRWHGPDWIQKGEDKPIVVDGPKEDG